MKIYATILLVILATASVSYAKPKPKLKEEVTILPLKEKNTLYFKVNKAFIGGLVEVYDESNNCLESDSLPHTHTMIYFDEAQDGQYVVRVKKNNKAIEFKYKNSCAN